MRRVVTALSILILLLVPLIFLSGCGGGGGEASSKPGTAASAPVVSESDQEVIEDIEDPETAKAVLAAVHYAEDANSGSEFEVGEACVAEGWCKVNVRQTGVPRDQAVTFDLYLREGNDGAWTIVESGTGLTSEDVPGAPPDLFD
ncbi:MAG: hypothetical protein KKF41_02945 [Actinobacteria bacterium]|nr:hypothetical protein [Actinomycetota bacterium]MBU1943356.1 hypothetical protein [Actinomycetota bacterium]MBU2686526.1 hypothetical protein [Actinomycetota bacterium]